MNKANDVNERKKNTKKSLQVKQYQQPRSVQKIIHRRVIYNLLTLFHSYKILL